MACLARGDGPLAGIVLGLARLGLGEDKKSAPRPAAEEEEVDLALVRIGKRSRERKCVRVWDGHTVTVEAGPMRA